MAIKHDEFLLTEDQKDLFKELINIAYGRAAGLLHDFTEVEVNLHVPQLDFLDHESFLAQITQNISDEMVVSQQAFQGKIAGETLIVFSQDEATKLSCLLNQGELPQDEMALLAAVYEVGNIVTTTSMQTLSELSQSPIDFNKPITNQHSPDSLASILQQIDYSQVISISTYLDIPTENINAKIYYLFYRQSMALLAQSLQFTE